MALTFQKTGASVFQTGSGWNTAQGQKEVKRVIEEGRYDLVDFHFCDPRAFTSIFRRCRKQSVSVLFHYHGEIRPINTLNWKNRYFSTLRLASMFVDRFVAVSKANADFLRSLHVAAPITVVLNGIDIPRFTAEYSAAVESIGTSTPEAPLFCLYVGSLTQRKRVDVLLRAFAMVRQQIPNAELTIVGGGEKEKALKSLANELNLDETAVAFKGLMKDFPFDLLAACQILVSASESESFGLVFVEGMSFGRPIVACKVGGIPEVVLDGKTGKLVTVNDPEALSEAIVELLRDETKRKSMGLAARKRAEDCFQLSRCVEETLAVFREML